MLFHGPALLLRPKSDSKEGTSFRFGSGHTLVASVVEGSGAALAGLGALPVRSVAGSQTAKDGRGQ